MWPCIMSNAQDGVCLQVTAQHNTTQHDAAHGKCHHMHIPLQPSLLLLQGGLSRMVADAGKGCDMHHSIQVQEELLAAVACLPTMVC